MCSIKLEKILYWVIRACSYVLPFCLLYIANSLFFPFITGKNFLFRIIVEIMLAVWVGLLFIDRKKYWPHWNFVSLIFVLFVFIILLSAIFGVDFAHSFWSNFERMEGAVTYLHLLALFFILSGTFRTRREWFGLFAVSIVVSFFLALYGLFEYFGFTDFGGGARIMSTLGNPLYVAAYLTFNIFLILFLGLLTRSLILKLALGILFLFELSVFFLTGSRGGFLGMLAGLGIISVLWFFMARGKKKLFIGGVIILLILIPVLLNIFKDVSFIKNNNVISRFSHISLKDQTVQSRFTIWKMAFESFKQRPVLGWGVGNFVIPYAKNYNPKMYGNEPWFDRTHSMPFEWLSSTGAIGFLTYLSVFIAILWTLMRGLKRGLLSKAGTVVFVGMFIAYASQMFFVFDTLATFLMTTMFLGFLCVLSFSNKEDWLSRKIFSESQREDIDSSEYKNLSKKKKRELRRQQRKQVIKLVSGLQASGLVAVFIIVIVLIIFINIRPWMAARSLIITLGALNQQEYVAAKENFEKALSLSGGIIGTEEIREHLAMNMLYASQNPESFKNPDVRNLYMFALGEMEKQVEENSKENLKIKHNILLGQLYYGLGVVEEDSEMMEKALGQYRQANEFAPNYIHLYPLLSNTLAKNGNIREAASVTEKAEALLTSVDKYDPNIFYSKSLFYVALRDYEKAYTALQKIVSDYSGPDHRLDSGRMQNILSTARLHGPDAIPLLEEIYVLDKHLVSNQLLLAQLYVEAGGMERARFYAYEALQNDPSLETQIRQFIQATEKSPE